MIGEHSLVAFKTMTNARGYPLTGVVIDCDDTHAIVNAFGLYGPGSETQINDVPLSDLRECDDITTPEGFRTANTEVNRPQG